MIAVPGATAVLRALLLLLTAVGVAGMHTLGHPGGHGRSAVIPAHASSDRQAHTAAGPVQVIALLEIAVPEAAVPLAGGGLGPWQVCLAVLTLAGLAVVVAAGLFAVRRRTAVRGVVRTAVPVSCRAPPRPWFGLVLTDLSVLRI